MHLLARSLSCQSRHLSVCSIRAHARAQAGDNGVVSAFVNFDRLRNVELCFVIRQAESGWHDADDFVMACIDRDLLPDDIRSAAEQSLPCTVAEHNFAWLRSPVLAGTKCPAKQRLCTEGFEEVSCNGKTRYLLASAVAKQIHRRCQECRHRLEGVV